jgi:exosome complex component MTR3
MSCAKFVSLAGLRKLCGVSDSILSVLKTGLVPAATGSAYLELEAPTRPTKSFLAPTSTIKLSCAVHGPKPVSRTSSFSPNLQVNATVKFAPFATNLRRGYLRDASERDLGTHLETAIKGVIIPDRWPKSAIEVVVTVLEGDEDSWNLLELGIDGVGMMNVLAGCITVASAALADARIDCLDLLAGGVAAAVSNGKANSSRLLDPCPVEHVEILSACVVGYLPSRDEITEIWVRGDLAQTGGSGSGFEELVESAVSAARGAQLVQQEAVKESAERWMLQEEVKSRSQEVYEDP